ncbi:response regulator [Piscinibacter terrae]|uniref:Response regulator n=1 Tax=Piscinibacter terrae TaxID=2496871 RepID=A0A3N7HKQ1_9BURK|nr:response regulator [Albitalea terrae]RQP22667.1 response regulator [Albitalea terrae]
MSTPLRLLVVDDHTLFRRGLVALLSQHPQVQVVAEAGDAGEAQRHAVQHQPDVILLDNHLPGVRGVDAVPGLREASPSSRILMLTVSEDADDLAAALRGGAQGYVLKTIDSDALLAAIERCAGGECVVSPELTPKLVQALRSTGPADEARADPLATLSPREREITAQIARGSSNKEIARVLDIAETTVKIHVQHILRKLGLSSRVQAAVFASEHGLR